MAEQMTLEKANKLRDKHIQANEDLGVVSYKSGERQSDQVYEVVEGYKHLPGVGRIGPGSRFHPTENQVASGSLAGKARELTSSEYSGLRRHQDESRKPQVSGADIGLRAFKMAPTTLRRAMEAGLTEEDFASAEPAGGAGQFTADQVEAMITSKTSEED